MAKKTERQRLTITLDKTLSELTRRPTPTPLVFASATRATIAQHGKRWTRDTFNRGPSTQRGGSRSTFAPNVNDATHSEEANNISLQRTSTKSTGKGRPKTSKPSAKAAKGSPSKTSKTSPKDSPTNSTTPEPRTKRAEINLKPTPAPWEAMTTRPPNQGRVHKEKRYHLARWKRLRLGILRATPLCIKCEQLATVVDHIRPARLGGKFWDSSNLQSMCASCHNSKSSAESRGE